MTETKRFKKESSKDSTPFFLAALADFNKETTESASRVLATELDIKPGILINGMRTALTGQLAGPGMFDILVALGKERVINRLKNIDHLYDGALRQKDFFTTENTESTEITEYNKNISLCSLCSLWLIYPFSRQSTPTELKLETHNPKHGTIKDHAH